MSKANNKNIDESSGKNKPVVASFFSGCGGLDLGFEQAGFDVIVANDKWEPAAETYRNNFSDVQFIERDIRDVQESDVKEAVNQAGYSTSDVDVVVGGPPCQGFSRLNNNEIELDEMEKDDRNVLFEEFLRVVEILDPHLVLMENVRDLVNRQTSDGKYVKDIIIERYNEKGYDCQSKVLKSEQFGVPQKRRRLFFIGTNKDSKLQFPSPTTEEGEFKTSNEALKKISDDLPNMNYANTMDKTLKKIKHIPQGGYYQDLPERLKTKKHQCDCEDTETCPHEPEIVKRYGTYLRRLHPEEPSLTVSNNPFIHPTEDRYITPREKARLQDFPDDFAFSGNKTEVTKQIGNAVPVSLSQELARQFHEYLSTVSATKVTV